MNHTKDLYAILGVVPDATPDAIREAYLARVRVLHPDRFNPELQPREWHLANEMLANLNEAYNILRAPASRIKYDSLRNVTMRPSTTEQPKPRPPPSTSKSSQGVAPHLRKVGFRITNHTLAVIFIFIRPFLPLVLLVGLLSGGEWACDHIKTNKITAHKAVMQKMERPLPYSGKVRFRGDGPCVAPFQIKASYGNHYLLKLVRINPDEDVLDVFVRSGTTVEIKVPMGEYEVRYASGETWYGYDRLFGPETSYSKADTTFAFLFNGDQIRGYTVTLYKVANGNLRTSKINPNSF